MRLIPGLRRRLRGVPHEVEGITHLGTRYFVSVCRKEGPLRAEVHVLDDRLRPVAMRDFSLWGLEHAGGLVVHKGRIILPLAEYRPVVRRPSRLVVIDSDLRILSVLTVIPDHIGGVFVLNGLYFLFSWDSKRYYVLNEGLELLKVANSPVVGIQDFAVGPEGLIFSTVQNEDVIVVLRVEGLELEVVEEAKVLKGDSTNGITWVDGNIMVAWSDGKNAYYRKYRLLHGSVP